MKPEQRVWDNLNKKMRGYWKADRIETDTTVGYQDVVYTCQGVTGKLELKHLNGFPARPDTIVKFKRFTIQQVNHALNTQYYGGKAGMFSQIGNELFYHGPDAMRTIFKSVNSLQFINLASWYCESWSSFNRDEFMEMIT
jgi:hypothetical protein